MQITRHGEGICVQTPAKVNLYLDVLRRREDGYHEVETLLCPIALFDELLVTPSATPGVTFSLETPPQSADASDPAWQIPADENNLVVRGVKRLTDLLCVPNFGCHIALSKCIPAAAGLAGGSGNLAGAITGVLALLGRWNRQLATQICGELGSDIPFFLGDDHHGFGLAVGTGRGEHLRFLDSQPALHFVITHPPTGCSTSEIYSRYIPSDGPHGINKIIGACQNGQASEIGDQLFNALQSTAEATTAWIGSQLDFLRSLGFQNVLMSGSGSSCFALVRQEYVADHITESARKLGLSRVYMVDAFYGSSIEEQLQALP